MAGAWHAPPMTQNSEAIWRHVEALQDPAIALSDRVWGMPELAYAEHRSAAEHTAFLREHGFASRSSSPASPPPCRARRARVAPSSPSWRVRRAARPVQRGEQHRAPSHPRRRQRPCLRPQPAGRRLPAGRRRREGLAGRERHRRPRALLWLPGRGGRRRQGLHGPRRLLRRRGHRHLLASQWLGRGERAAEPRQYPHRLHLPRPRQPRRRRAASGPLGARCRRADERGRELPARAHPIESRIHYAYLDAAGWRPTWCRPRRRCATSSAPPMCATSTAWWRASARSRTARR
jgi:hypothetical protein